MTQSVNGYFKGVKGLGFFCAIATAVIGHQTITNLTIVRTG
jgi:hypothetical protein